MHRPHLSIVGLPGVGKTTVADAVAGRLGMSAVDLDERIEAAAGRDVAEIFASEGEAGFRDREEAVLAELVDPDEPRWLVSCGGGVIVRAANRRRLRSRTRCVWLDADPTVLADRLWAERSTRPLLGGAVDRAALVRRLHALRDERAGYFEEVAADRIDVGALTPSDVVAAFVGAVA